MPAWLHRREEHRMQGQCPPVGISLPVRAYDRCGGRAETERSCLRNMWYRKQSVV